MRLGGYHTMPCSVMRICSMRPQTSWQRPMPRMGDSFSARRWTSRTIGRMRGLSSIGSWSSASGSWRRWEDLADGGDEDLDELSDHFGGHPKTAGRTFTGGSDFF